MNAGPFDDTATFDATLIQHTEIQNVQARYGVCAWFGFFTRHWWALVDTQRGTRQTSTVVILVEAETPQQLGDRIQTARRP